MAGLDGLCALALVLVSAVYGNLGRIPGGSVAYFLEMRVTLLNVMFATVFVVTWMFCFRVMGLYRLTHHDLFRDMKRTVQACAMMTGLLALYLFISRTKGPTLRIAVVFFLAALTFEMLRLSGGARLQLWLASRNPRLVVILGSGRKAGIA